ncbi:MAG TPA: ATP synthase F1 subunit delta [Candidatus Hydrogenedentes bacterium]|nr:ATP synthase F1 subunit delta [Candidatus Hydrogenedentota bacterium]HPC15193.1 ATP synthase F1 subunit delta [Candidatus Hydrogenedentota bacterium]HRT19552.1 ATP synthase F1 subunit delta [Candidatus Hydrogenedentota bacterium]HRT64192.1 ATP synthase F1 subunit delta [Candidatus Hydrogenedentota bacterium]
MRGTLLADRYARALRGAITDSALLEEASHVLNRLAALHAGNSDFRMAMENPVIEMAARRRLLDAVLEALAAPPEVSRLLHTMLERNRMAALPQVASRFESHINEWLNRVEASVVTAVPLTPELETKLVHSLQRFSGKTVYLKCKVDPGIIGGLAVYMRGVFFDFSVRTRLERLKQKLLTEEMTHGN